MSSRCVSGLACLLSCCALTLVACSPKPVAGGGAQEPAGPHVTRVEPGDELTRLDQEVRVHFDQEMVSIDAVGPALEQLPVRVEPALPLLVHWADRNTLALRPELSWKAGDRYVITLDPAFFRTLAGARTFTLDALPLRTSYLSAPAINAPHDLELDAFFTAAVDETQVAARCALVSEDGARVAVALRPQPPARAVAQDEPERVRLRAATRLLPETRYRLRCEGLTARGHSAPWRSSPHDEGFLTHGPLRVLALHPAGGTTPTPEDAELCLELSTPVTTEQLGKHVHLSPAPVGLADSWFEGSCGATWSDTHRKSSILLPARTPFRIHVDPELTDVFGQNLGAAVEQAFATSDRQPGLWTLTGQSAVLELGRSGHAVGTLNLTAAQLTCARLTPEQLAAGFEAASSWLAREDGQDGQPPPPAPWTVAGLRAASHRLDATSGANVGRVLPIDLGASCGRAPGAPGLYALELQPLEPTPTVHATGRQGDRPARVIANVTDLALLAKRGEHNALVWASSLSTGAVVAGASVAALDVQGHVLARGHTDARGLCMLRSLPRSEGETFFAVRHGDDEAIVGTDWLWREGLSPWQLGVRESYENEETRLFVHLDRGVYRPGERVLVHGLVREMPDGAPARVPAARQVKLELTLASEVINRELQLNEFGAFSDELVLSAHVVPGSYNLNVTAAGKTEAHEVRMAELRPLTFELEATTPSPELLAPAQAHVEVAARYLFGAPLADAPLRVTVERAPASLEVPSLPGMSFEDRAPALPNEEPVPEEPSGIVLERELHAGKDGHAAFDFPAEARRGPSRYTVSVEATDQGQDRATTTLSVLAHSAERYPGVRTLSRLLQAGEPLLAELAVVDRAGTPVAGEVELELRHARWSCEDPLKECHVKTRVLATQRAQVAAGKPTLVRFTESEPGELHVRARVRDAAGRSALASDSAWVWAPEGAGPYADRVAQPLLLDKRRYRIGESARLSLQTPHAPRTMLATRERGDVLDARVIDVADGPPTLALPASSAPNVFLTLSGVVPRSGDGEQGRPKLVAGAEETRVDGPSRVLQASIELPRERFEPGQPVTGEVRVTHLGKAVPAEVSVVVVNESVLQLTGFATPDPTSVMHAPRGLGVRTVSNVMRVIGDPAARARVPEVAHTMAEAGDGGGGRPELRDDYVAAAYFAPALRTDAHGIARFAFDAPSDLSAYRIMVVAAAKDDRVGSGARRITVEQSLSVRPLAPRFVSAGDELELGGLVHDHTGARGQVTLRWAARGLTLGASSSAVPSGGQGTATGSVLARVLPGQSASFEVEADKAGQRDHVGRSLQVRTPLDRELRVLHESRASQARARLDWPKGIDPTLSRLEVSVDRVGLAPLAPLLATLLDYPYGCTEQTAASLLAMAAVPELAAAIVPELHAREALERRIADGVSRLVRAQADDGFALYPGMAARPWLRVVVVEAALALRAAGFAVPDALLRAPVGRLYDGLQQRRIAHLSADERKLAAHAVAVLAAAGRPQLDAEEQLYALRQTLGPLARAQLLSALARHKGDPARRAELRRGLADAALSAQPRTLDAPFDSPERTLAVVLLALHEDGAERAAEDRLAAQLRTRAADPELYLSTRDIADVLVALSRWASNASAGGRHVEIGLGDRVLWQGTLSGAEVATVLQPAAQAPAGEVWVRADGDVTISIRRRDVSPSAPKPAFSRGLSVVRRYLDPKTRKPLERVRLGDLVQVEVLVHSERPLRMVVLSDALPAGLEPLDPGLSSGRIAGCARCDDQSGFDHVTRRDDRVEAFAELLPAGTQALRYVLRATLAGRFTAPGAVVEPMYAPALYARSAVTAVSVTR